MQQENKNELFARSVEKFSADDIKNTRFTRQRSSLPSLLVRSTAIALCIGILGYSCYRIIDKVAEDSRASAAYEDLRVDEDVFTTIAKSKSLQEPNAMPTVLQMLNADGNYEAYVPSPETSEEQAQHYDAFYANFLKVADKYDNVYAWIYMTDTNGRVNYPVMKGSDNEYYLTHDFKGNASHSGSIFADRGVSDNYYSNRNMVLYGHNMKDGSMFHSVKTWCNSAKIKTLVQTTQIEIYTREGIYIYDILSYYVDSGTRFASVTFKSEADYTEFLKSISKKSNIKTNRPYSGDSRICTLITCTNGSNGSSRYVVHGILNRFLPRG